MDLSVEGGTQRDVRGIGGVGVDGTLVTPFIYSIHMNVRRFTLSVSLEFNK